MFASSDWWTSLNSGSDKTFQYDVAIDFTHSQVKSCSSHDCWKWHRPCRYILLSVRMNRLWSLNGELVLHKKHSLDNRLACLHWRGRVICNCERISISICLFPFEIPCQSYVPFIRSDYSDLEFLFQSESVCLCLIFCVFIFTLSVCVSLYSLV